MIEGCLIECRGGGAAEFEVDLGEEVVGKVGLAGAISGKRALGRATIGI